MEVELAMAVATVDLAAPDIRMVRISGYQGVVVVQEDTLGLVAQVEVRAIQAMVLQAAGAVAAAASTCSAAALIPEAARDCWGRERPVQHKRALRQVIQAVEVLASITAVAVLVEQMAAATYKAG